MGRYPYDLDMSVLENRKFSNAAYFAASDFVGIRNSGWSFGLYDFRVSDGLPYAKFRRGDFGTAQAIMILKRDWMSVVHAHHLHVLPEFEWFADPMPGDRVCQNAWEGEKFVPVMFYALYPVFILDAGRPFFSENAWCATATWIVRGRQQKSGHIVWTNKSGIDGPIQFWAVGSTEEKARGKLLEHIEKQRRHDLRLKRIEEDKRLSADSDLIAADADALAAISF